MNKMILAIMLIVLWLLCGTLLYLMRNSKAPTTKTDRFYILFICISETIYLLFLVANKLNLLVASEIALVQLSQTSVFIELEKR